MKILLLTNEYPPHIYGGAGVHVDNLARELCRLKEGGPELEILCFGDQKVFGENMSVRGVGGPSDPSFDSLRHKKFLEPMLRNLVMTGLAGDADLVHCHTWYTHLAGCLIQQMMNIPLVITTHSLEPLRPWKKEQLKEAYQATSWLEKTALMNSDGIIAVSRATKNDILSLFEVDPARVRVIYNGIDADRYRKTENPEVLKKYGIDPDKPYVLFVGRITSQKGIIHLVDAIPRLDQSVQVVLCAGAPDTDVIGAEMTQKVEKAESRFKNNIVWIPKWIPKEEVIPLYSHATLFICPSVYEPFGIINLEAMACETPVVASATGGITEVVQDGETGLLVPFEPLRNGDLGPANPGKFSTDLAAAVNSLLQSPEKIKRMGAASRHRVEKLFSWEGIAKQTIDFYRELIENHNK